MLYVIHVCGLLQPGAISYEPNHQTAVETRIRARVRGLAEEKQTFSIGSRAETENLAAHIAGMGARAGDPAPPCARSIAGKNRIVVPAGDRGDWTQYFDISEAMLYVNHV
jgi:hypothetical protein